MGPGSTRDVTARDRLGLLVVLGVAFGLRLWHLLDQPNTPWYFRPRADAYFYHANAQAIAGGDWLLHDQALQTSPGYTYFLGALYALAGDGPLAPRVVQLLLGVGLVALVWDSARRAFGTSIAWLPALAAAAYGPLIWFEGHLLSDGVGAFTHALLLWQIVRVLTRAPARRVDLLALGLAWGLACVVRPNALLLVVPVAYAAWAAGTPPHAARARAAALATAALGAALVIAPVTLRNLSETGEPILLTASAAIPFYVGNTPGATGTWRTTPEIPDSSGPRGIYAAFHATAERMLERPLSLRESNDYWMRLVLGYLASHPGFALQIYAQKLHLYWNGRELHDIYDYEFARTLSPVLGLPLVQWLVVAPFALVGALCLLFRSRVERAIALFLLTTMAAIVIAYVSQRLRLPAIAPALLAATGLVRVAQEAFAARARGRLAGLALALALAGALAVPVPVNKRLERKFYGLASAWLALDRPGRATRAFEQSLAADPHFLPSLEKLSVIYADAGERERALLLLERWREQAAAQGDTSSAQRAEELGRRLDASE